MSKSEKPHLNLVIMGHVDHGKTTTTGHLLYLAGAIDERTIKAYQEEAEKMPPGSNKKNYSFLFRTFLPGDRRFVNLDKHLLKRCKINARPYGNILKKAFLIP